MATSYILDAVRTPRGRGKAGKGALSAIHPQELLAQLLAALPQRTGLSPREVDDVIAGCVSQVGEQGANVARNAVLAAGWPNEVSAVSINRFCASGLQAVHFAAMGVGSGATDLAVAGGVESMSRVPMGSDGGGQDGNNLHLRERLFQVPQGISADLIATLEGFSRQELDAVALRSQQNAARAIEAGRFVRSLVPVTDPATGAPLLQRDEFPRPDTTAAGLAALPAAFASMGELPAGPDGETLDELALRAYPQAGRVHHLHTAGNSSGIVDGAAAVVLASERYVRDQGVTPRARIRAMATLGSEPVLMLTAPAPVSQKALRIAGMQASDIDLWEINEAFAA
ncbi:MAG: 3-ketoacyl-CoA thiolase, partial [bacterium]|nr:3-ketoacyl-CoA thiolase [bacterium]